MNGASKTDIGKLTTPVVKFFCARASDSANCAESSEVVLEPEMLIGTVDELVLSEAFKALISSSVRFVYLTAFKGRQSLVSGI